MADGAIFDPFGVRMPNPGNGRSKRVRVDAEDNAVFQDVFIRPTTSSTRQSVRTLAPGNVKSFGAIGDGVADDTAAIQAAYAADLCLYFPEGTYRVSSTLTMPATSHWSGCGRGTIISSSADTCVALGSESILEGFQIVYTGANLTTSRTIDFSTTWAIVENVWTLGAAWASYCTAGGSYVRFDRCRLIGILLAQNATSHVALNCTQCLFETTTNAPATITSWNTVTLSQLNGNVWRSQSGVATAAHTFDVNSTGNLVIGLARVSVGGTFSDATSPQSNGYVIGSIHNTTNTFTVDAVQVVTNRQAGWAAGTQVANPTADTRTAVVDVATVTGTEEKKMAMLLNFLLTDLKTHGLIGA